MGELRPAGLGAELGGQAGLGLASPGPAQPPKRLHFLRIFKVFGPQNLKNSRRASRAGNALFPKVFKVFGPLNPKFFRRASRAGNASFPYVFKVFGPQKPKTFPARIARRKPSFS